jgi:3-oxoadipate enol-lactonase
MKHFTYSGSDGAVLHAARFGAALAGVDPGEPEPPTTVLMHGGGPDHHSLVPLARHLVDLGPVVLPDVRGYGRSICADPARHTWAQYAADVAALLNHLGARTAVLGGTGLGATIALRTAVAHPARVRALVLISLEDIEDDEAKAAEVAFMDAFAARVRAEGIEAAWSPILHDLAPIIGTMVRQAIPRSDPASIAAAAAIGRDRSFRSIDELAGIAIPTLLIPGMDARHPSRLAEALARLLPRGDLAPVALSAEMTTVQQFADAVAPAIRTFLRDLVSG